VRATGSVVTFVDTQFSEDALGEKIRSLLDGVRRIEIQPMALRSIFTTLARATRDGAACKEWQR
jgi:ABC-2 type transport system ATP-binding protein